MDIPNISYINELSGNDIQFRESFIQMLKDEFPLEKIEYIDNINSNNTEAAWQIVHKLKHKMNILGLEESYKTAVIFEEELRLGNSRLNDEFMKIMNTIENFLKTI